jgi:acylphosphatase
MSEYKRSRIIVDGVVQGVGFRYFVYRVATSLNLKGYTKNLINGQVIIEIEGEQSLINELIKIVRVGPKHAHVTNCVVEWIPYKNEFTNFEIRHY